MLLKWQNGIVQSVEQLTPNTARYRVALPDTPQFDFKPGQFVTLDLPIHEQRNKRWRSYSIASAPDGGNVIELVIARLEGGAGTQYLFEEVQPGSTLTLRGPAGVFVLPEAIDHDLFMICTGTGIAPFRSMLHYIKEHRIAHKNIYLIFGTRTQADLLYAEEMWTLEKEIENFKYLPTLSREDWQHHTGYVHPIYEQHANGQPARFMLCGWRDMVDEAQQRITQNLGYSSKDVVIEIYG